MLSMGFVIYAVGYTVLQFNNLTKLHVSNMSAFGQAKSPFEFAQYNVNFFAKQWQSLEFQSANAQKALLEQWYSAENIRYIAVYNDIGELLAKLPEQTSLLTELANQSNMITAAAHYTKAEDNGRIVMLFDNSEMQSLLAQRNIMHIKIITICGLVGIVIGGYLFRGLTYFYPKTRQ